MKKILLFVSLSLISSLSFGQLVPLNDIIVNDLSVNNTHTPGLKSTTCGIDTIQYPTAKATGYSALNINNATSAQALCQYYNAPQAITISGAEFYAYKIDATGGITMNVSLDVYLAGVDSMPTGMPLASAVVAVDTSFGGGNLSVLRKIGTFTPITISAPYVIVVGNYSATPMGLVSNSYTAADGAQEWLSGVDIGGTWLRSYAVNVGGTVYDADLIVQPFVQYNLNADFTVGNACLSAGPTVTFNNTSSPVLFDRMYNVAEFIGSPELSFSWDYDDGSPIDNAVNGLNIYSVTSNVSYDVMLTDTLFGWTSNCFTDTVISIGDSISADWSFTPNGSSVDFIDQSFASGGGVTNYLWDFGDGNTSTLMNPTHTYAAQGTYTVCLIVSSACSSDSSCQTVNATGCSNPIASFTTVNNDPSFDFTNTSTTTGSASYNWDMGDGTTYTTTDASHTYGANGTYIVTLTVTDSCGTNISIFTVVVATVGLDGMTIMQEDMMFPNPSNGLFTIHSSVSMESVELIDMTGKVIKQIVVSGGVLDVNAQNLSNGNYLVRVHRVDGSILQTKLEIAK